jgi:hypothetical protein
MLYEATVSFSGLISMRKGERRTMDSSPLIEDLLKAGLIIKVEATDTPKAEKKGKGRK